MLQNASEVDEALVGGLHVPRDIWSVILAIAAAPLQHLPDRKDGRSHAARWLDLALVCKQWHKLMMQQPVGLRLDDDSCPPTSGSGFLGSIVATYSSGGWTAVAALQQLAAGSMPVCSLYISVTESPSSPAWLRGCLTARHGELTVVSRAISEMFRAASFQAVSGPHLTDVLYEYERGFRLKVAPEAFPKLQRLGIVYAGLESGLPRSLQTLKIEGQWETIDYDPPASGASSLGTGYNDPDVCAWLASLRQLSTLSITGCSITKGMRAAMPPSLEDLQLHHCFVDGEDDGLPPHMRRTSYREHGDGLCSCRYELAPGTAETA